MEFRFECSTADFVLPLITWHFRIDLMPFAVSRSIASLIGLLAYYTVFFMYEDEEGRWQNRIEKLWVAIDDKAKTTGSRTSALFNKVSIVVTQGFDKIFGPRLFSFRFVGISTSYSFAGFCLSGFLLFAILLRINPLLDDPLPGELLASGPLVERVFLIGGFIFLLFALLPSFAPSRLFVFVSLVPAFFWTIGLPLQLLLSTSSHKHKALAIYAALIVSFLSDVFLIALVRFTIRWVSIRTSVSRIAVAALLQAGVFILVLLVPLDIGISLIGTIGPRPELMALVCVAFFNVFTGLTSCMFLIALLFVLLHKIVWPILSRSVYPLARHHLIRSRTVMGALGTGCIIFAFPQMPAAIKSILRWLTE